MTLDDYFEQVCREGLQKRLETNVAHLRSRGLLRKTIDEYGGSAESGDRLY